MYRLLAAIFVCHMTQAGALAQARQEFLYITNRDADNVIVWIRGSDEKQNRLGWPPEPATKALAPNLTVQIPIQSYGFEPFDIVIQRSSPKPETAMLGVRLCRFMQDCYVNPVAFGAREIRATVRETGKTVPISQRSFNASVAWNHVAIEFVPEDASQQLLRPVAPSVR